MEVIWEAGLEVFVPFQRLRYLVGEAEEGEAEGTGAFAYRLD